MNRPFHMGMFRGRTLQPCGFPNEPCESCFHSTAIVEDGARIGKFTKIWYFSHVASGAIIGENCSLGQNTYVETNAVVGNACRLGNSVSVFSHVELEDFVFRALYGLYPHFGLQKNIGENGGDARRQFDRGTGYRLRDRHIFGRRLYAYKKLQGLVDDGRHPGASSRMGERVRGENRPSLKRRWAVAMSAHGRCLRFGGLRFDPSAWTERYPEI